MKRKAKFSNAALRTGGVANPSSFSDRGPENPILGNRPGNIRRLPAPTSGGASLDQRGEDYFRRDPNAAGQFPSQPDWSITPERITLSVRMRFDAIRGLTFERLTSYLEQWQLGFFRMAGITWDQMERRDYQLKVDVPKRRKSVARHGWEVELIKDVPEADQTLAAAQKTFLEKFYQNIRATSAVDPSQTGGMRLLAYQMMDAVGKYYSAHEIVWQPMPDGDLTAQFIHVPVWWLEGTRGKLRFLQSEFQVYGVDMPDGEWLITCGDGLMEASSIVYMFKNLPIKSWLQLLTRLGEGALVGKTPAVYGSPEWNNFVDALRDFAENWAGAFSRDTDISFLESKNVVGDGPFNALIEKMEKAITRMWRGGDMATSGQKNAVGATLQEDESDILEQDDPKILEEALDDQVTKYALAWKFGPDAPRYAYITFNGAPEVQDVSGDLAVDAFLLPLKLLTKKDTLARYKRPAPGKDDEILSGPAPQGPQPAGEDPDAAGITNEAAAETFEAAARAQLAAAVHEDLRQMAGRVQALGGITDEAQFRRNAAQLLNDYPGILTDAILDPQSARGLAGVIGSAYAHALQKPGSQILNGDLPGHDFHGNQYTDAPARITPAEADKRLTDGFTVNNTEGKPVRFGARLKSYLDRKPDGQERKTFLNHAAATVAGGDKISMEDRDLYTRTFRGADGKAKGIVAIAATPEGEVFNIYRKDPQAMGKVKEKASAGRTAAAADPGGYTAAGSARIQPKSKPD